jgi:hypothetical protein
LHILLRRRFDISFGVYTVELATLDGICEGLIGSLDALEERVVFIRLASCCFLVRVMSEYLLTCGLLDLLVGGFVAVFR